MQPSIDLATIVAKKLLGLDVLSCTRLTTGNQNFVYLIKTYEKDFVLRQTPLVNKHYYEAALYWQKTLLQVPIVPFIYEDIDAKLSEFSSVMMPCVSGSDLCNIYKSLTVDQKIGLAQEIVAIQKSVRIKGSGYGYTTSHIGTYNLWYDFLKSRLDYFMSKVDNPQNYKIIYTILNSLKSNFDTVESNIFLYDTSERNVMVHEGKISGIVDVDSVCCGDSLMVLALTAVALEKDGFDSIYTNNWESLLNLNTQQKQRLNFYKLFYALSLLKSVGKTSLNNQMNMDNSELLNQIFIKYLKTSNFDFI